MPLLNDWIDEKLAFVAKELPYAVQSDPASFKSGYLTGVKTAMLELECFMNRLDPTDELKTIFHDEMSEFCGD